ncbi:phosphotransferase [Tistrella mobilis]|uniref:phosphotransferase n=1 Tax=Tistrella mobilis TaxID=171437 RepID=UPI00355849AC
MSTAPDTGTPDTATPETGALEAWFADHIPGRHGRLALERFAGGQSNPTFRIRSEAGTYVLRRKPLGEVLPSAHAVDREFRVLAALQGTGVPVPPVHALCTDPAVFGSMFYVMDFVPGRIFWDPRLPDLTPAERGAIFSSMNDAIARIHALDPDAIGLGDHGRRGNYVERQIARWTRQYRASETVANPAMERLIQWLPEHVPAEDDTRLVHGDYRLDNVIIHPTEPRVVAVLDWELSTLGNPLADFAYHMMTWRIAPGLFRGLAGTDFAAAGIPDERAYLEMWLARTGFAPSPSWDVYVVLSLFRLAAILQGIARRAQDGTAANADAEEVGRKAVPLAELAWSFAEKIR